MQRPELSVVVASHDRPLRLRWLLNALQEQTLEPALWEVVVCHDSAGPETGALLRAHPLAAAGRLRALAFAPGAAAAAAKRNAGAALARAPTLVFTDDDCRPPAGWLQGVRAAVRERPGAVVQGPVSPDPHEAAMLRSPFPRTQSFADVPRVWAESCNIAYPAELFAAAGGFAEDLGSGEDTDLSLRTQAAGGRLAGDPRMLTHHAVDEGLLWDRLRETRRWDELPLLLRRHPELRSELCLRVFWKREHAWLLLAVAGAAGGGLGRRRTPGHGHTALAAAVGSIAPLAALRWALTRRDHGGGARGRLRQVASLPGWALVDAAELAALARASLAHRSLVL